MNIEWKDPWGGDMEEIRPCDVHSAIFCARRQQYIEAKAPTADDLSHWESVNHSDLCRCDRPLDDLEYEHHTPSFVYACEDMCKNESFTTRADMQAWVKKKHEELCPGCLYWDGNFDPEPFEGSK